MPARGDSARATSASAHALAPHTHSLDRNWPIAQHDEQPENRPRTLVQVAGACRTAPYVERGFGDLGCARQRHAATEYEMRQTADQLALRRFRILVRHEQIRQQS